MGPVQILLRLLVALKSPRLTFRNIPVSCRWGPTYSKKHEPLHLCVFRFEMYFVASWIVACIRRTGPFLHVRSTLLELCLRVYPSIVCVGPLLRVLALPGHRAAAAAGWVGNIAARGLGRDRPCSVPRGGTGDVHEIAHVRYYLRSCGVRITIGGRGTRVSTEVHPLPCACVVFP